MRQNTIKWDPTEETSAEVFVLRTKFDNLIGSAWKNFTRCEKNVSTSLVAVMLVSSHNVSGFTSND